MNKKSALRARVKRPVVRVEYGFSPSLKSIRKVESDLKRDLQKSEAKLTTSVSIAARQYMGNTL